MDDSNEALGDLSGTRTKRRALVNPMRARYGVVVHDKEPGVLRCVELRGYLLSNGRSSKYIGTDGSM